MSDFIVRRSWLGLPPGAEAALPTLLASVIAADELVEAGRIEALICRGNYQSWMTYLRDRSRRVCEAGAASHAPARQTAAEILADQFTLAEGIRDISAEDEALRARLQAIT